MIHVCIPVHNEERTIGVLLWKVRKVMAEFGRDYRILVWDDASTDETRQVLEKYRRLLPLRIHGSAERVGHGAAVDRLLRQALADTDYPKRDMAVVLQGDFSEDPADLVDMVKAIEGGADLVAGTVDEESLPQPARFTRRVARLLFRRALTGAPVADPLSSFRVYRLIVVRKALREMETDGGGTLLDVDGWAASLQLLSRTASHARRIEERPYRLRRVATGRPSRFRARGALAGLFRARKDVAWNVLLVVAVAGAGFLFGGSDLRGQEPSLPADPAEFSVAAVPSGLGERAPPQPDHSGASAPVAPRGGSPSITKMDGPRSFRPFTRISKV